MKILLITILVLALAIPGYWAFTGKMPFSGGQDQRIVNACHETVAKNLKSPATAIFTASNVKVLQKPIYNESQNEYVYMGYVDSENGFGALVRTEYGCVISADLTSVNVILE